MIDPQAYAYIGHFLKGERHGKYIHFYVQGKVEGTCCNDQYADNEKTTFLDGTTKEKTYKNKTKILNLPGDEINDPEGGNANQLDAALLF